jgi:hypothetical protein
MDCKQPLTAAGPLWSARRAILMRERPPIAGRSSAYLLQEVVPEQVSGAEAGAVGDLLNGEVVLLEQLLDEQDPLPGQPLVWRTAGGRDEATGEGTG